jgi:hypothetical protein
VGDRAGYPLRDQMNTAMKLIRTAPSPALDVQELREHERPPIVTVPAYRTRDAAIAASMSPSAQDLRPHPRPPACSPAAGRPARD